MYCRNCGNKLTDASDPCPNCLAYESPQQIVYIPHPNMPSGPKYRTAGFVLGILSICIPFYGFILGVIGLPLACISRRKSSIVLNIIGIVVSILFFVLMLSLAFNAAREFHSAPVFHGQL